MTPPERAPDGQNEGRPEALPLIPAATEPTSAPAGDDSGTRRPWHARPRPDTASAAGADTIHDASAPPRPRRASAPFMRSHPLHLVSLGFGTGLAPLAPGLVGSLFGWLSFSVLNRHLDTTQWFALIAAALVLGVIATRHTARALGAAVTERPRAIVWDRIVAVWIVMLVITPAGFGAQLAAFVLYRLVERLRLPPLRHLDRRLKAGLGIMADDLVAAFVTLFVVAMWHALFSTPR